MLLALAGLKEGEMHLQHHPEGPEFQTSCKLLLLQTYGSRNIRNTIKAFIRGLESQVPQVERRELPSVQLKQYKRPRGTPSSQTVGLLSI